MNQIKLVIADIDGTLVTESREMTQRTIDNLQKLHENGIYFGIASGRPIDELAKNAKKWHLPFEPEFLVGMNGAQIEDRITGNSMSVYKLKVDWIKEIIELMEPFKEGNPFIYKDDYMLSRDFDAGMRAAMKRNGKEVHVMNDISDIWAEENEKVMVRFADETKVPAAMKYINEHPNPNWHAFLTQPTMIEFMDRRVNKGIALEKIVSMNDFELENVLAYGDMSNDNEMLEKAGFGVCLINGGPDTKACADAITEYDNDHDGLARDLEKRLPQYFKVN